jgi:cytochrome P450
MAPQPDERRCTVATIEHALSAWGDFDRDDPFPLFADVRRRGPVHHVTLADGHDAWLIVDFDEARSRSTINDSPRTCTPRSPRVMPWWPRGLPGPAFARHMLVVDPPNHTRLRRLVAGRVLRAPDRRSASPRRGDGRRVARCHRRQGPDAVVDLVESFAFPLPFTVICELLGIPAADRAPFGAALIVLLSPTATDEEYERAKQASDVVVGMLEALVEAKQHDPTMRSSAD